VPGYPDQLRVALLIPSLLSAARLLLTVPAARAVLDHHWTAALALSLIAGLTDAVDGWIARRWNLITRSGAWLDPVADKTLVSALYICLALTDAVPLWLVWLVFGRDAMILLLAAFALAFTPFRDFPPSVWGKLTTTLQVATVAVALARQAWPSPTFASALDALVLITAAATIGSGAHYFASGVQRMRGLR
jgi:cardiolipin synthase